MPKDHKTNYKANQKAKYEKLMKLCFKEALKGKGNVEPNPYVGAIVFDEEKDEIISKGYHQKFGQNHAEVNAILEAKGNTKGKTLIVNLEPCSHYGKTPPCADLIIKSGFKKVVMALYDPNPKVAGQGAKKLKNAGIEVIDGILEDEAKELNKVFLKNITTGFPYIMLKSATTLDSKIATITKKSKWITSEKSRKEVQKLRGSYQAIISATGTILEDNPKLTCRLKGKNSPIRIIFDPNNKIPPDYNVFSDDKTRIILVNNSDLVLPNHIEQIKFKDFKTLFLELYQKGIYSIMVEAGQGFNSTLLKEGFVDEINLFMAPKIFGSGLSFVDGIETKEIKEAIELNQIKIKKIGDDILINGKIKNNKQEG